MSKVADAVGTRKGSIKKNESDIMMLRRRGRRDRAEIEQNITENVTNINADISELELRVEQNETDIVVINEELDDLPNIYVQSVPIREIVVIERAEWEAIDTPDETILYCVYDEA